MTHIPVNTPNRNPYLDRARGVGAVCVLLLHAPPFLHSSNEIIRGFGWFLRLFFQVSVPFFFILSGWLLGRKLAQALEYRPILLRSSRRLLQVYIPWFLLFVLLDAIQGRPAELWPTVRRLVGFSDASLSTSGYHLWFLPSLLLAQAAITWEYARRRRVDISLICGAILYAVQLALEARDVTLPFGLVRHEGLNISLVCVATGVWLAIHPPTTRAFLRPNTGVIAGLGGLLVLEAILLAAAADKPWHVPGFTIVRILLAAALIRLLVDCGCEEPGGGRRHPLLDVLARNSTTIYVAHVLFLEAIPFGLLPISGFLRDNFIRWPVVLLACLISGALLRASRFKVIRDAAS